MTKDYFKSRMTIEESGCWVWTRCKDRNGYGRCGKGSRLAHRTAYEVFNGKFDQKLQVLHKCDNPGCINPEHLFLGNHLDNMKDKKKKGRSSLGEKNSMSKLSELDIISIRKRIENKECKRQIAKDYNITIGYIRHIKLRLTWKHI